MTYLRLQRLATFVTAGGHMWRLKSVKRMTPGQMCFRTPAVIAVQVILALLFLIENSQVAFAQGTDIVNGFPAAFGYLAIAGFSVAIMGAFFLLIGQKRYKGKQKANKEDPENSNM